MGLNVGGAFIVVMCLIGLVLMAVAPNGKQPKEKSKKK